MNLNETNGQVTVRLLINQPPNKRCNIKTLTLESFFGKIYDGSDCLKNWREANPKLADRIIGDFRITINLPE